MLYSQTCTPLKPPTPTRLNCRVVSGGVYSPVDSRDPVSNSTTNSIGQILYIFSFQFLDQIRRELVVNSIHTADATRQFESRRRRRCVSGIKRLVDSFYVRTSFLHDAGSTLLSVHSLQCKRATEATGGNTFFTSWARSLKTSPISSDIKEDR